MRPISTQEITPEVTCVGSTCGSGTRRTHPPGHGTRLFPPNVTKLEPATDQNAERGMGVQFSENHKMLGGSEATGLAANNIFVTGCELVRLFPLNCAGKDEKGFRCCFSRASK